MGPQPDFYAAILEPGEQVELNAITADQFIAWLEVKITQVSVTKVVPDDATLARAYRRAVRQRWLQPALSELDEADEMVVPEGLDDRIREKLGGSL